MSRDTGYHTKQHNVYRHPMSTGFVHKAGALYVDVLGVELGRGND